MYFEFERKRNTEFLQQKAGKLFYLSIIRELRKTEYSELFWSVFRPNAGKYRPE